MILCVNEVLPEKFEAINIWSCDLVWFLQPVLQRAEACCLVLIVRLVVCTSHPCQSYLQRGDSNAVQGARVGKGSALDWVEDWNC